MPKPRVLILTPALANSNNGNWQTAWRWAGFLRSDFDAHIAQRWSGEPFDAMLALHARRSADSIADWAKAHPGRTHNLGVVLTGTDLYRDIQTDASAQASLEMADQLVVLQECGPDSLPPGLRFKTRVIFQSCSRRQTASKPARHLRAVMVGHLRDEKSPETLFRTAELLRSQADILIDHIGEPLDAKLGQLARQTAATCPNYRWLGGMAHENTRRRIQQAHVLIHASKMEGGAHVVMEAVQSGTPVLASRIDGNVGMLGRDYAGYFDHGDAQGLANLLLKCRSDQSATSNKGETQHLTPPPSLLTQLTQQCTLRAPLFEPAHERQALIQLVNDLLNPSVPHPNKHAIV